VRTIQEGVDIAAGSKPSVVRVAAGTYAPFSMAEGVSVEGGYDPGDWNSVRNPAVHVTTVQNTATSGEYNAAVECAVPVAVAHYNTTKINGLTVRGGGGNSAVGVFVRDCSMRIERCVVHGGNATTFTYGIRFDRGVGTVVDSTIDGGIAMNTIGIEADNDGGPQIARNTISGGRGTAFAAGIRCHRSFCGVGLRNAITAGTFTTADYVYGVLIEGVKTSSATDGFITFSTIDGGTGARHPRAVFVRDGAKPSITRSTIIGNASGSGVDVIGLHLYLVPRELIVRDNTIRGGMGLDTRGVLNEVSDATISYNLIEGGTATVESIGVNNLNNTAPGAPLVYGNRIYGGSAGTSAVGIFNYSSPTIQFNNMVHGGDGPGTFGIIHNEASGGVVRNNTIFSGTGPNANIGLRLGRSARPVIDNNLFFGGNAGATLSYGVFEAEQGGIPFSFRNNAASGFRTAYYRRDFQYCGVSNHCTMAAANAIYFGVGANGGNIDQAPRFIDQDGPDDILATMADNNWKPAPNPSTNNCEIRQGGLNGAVAMFGFTDDLLQIPRTATFSCVPTNGNAAGWSMGAIEAN
jgi:hypothetical protein